MKHATRLSLLLLLTPGPLVAQPAPAQTPPTAPEEPALPAPDRAIEKLEEELEAAQDRVESLEDRLDLLEALSEDEEPPLPRVIPVFLNALNPRITVFANATYRADTRAVHGEAPESSGVGQRIDNRFSLRETEVDFRAAVSPFVDALLVITLEEEAPGEFHVGVEEGYALVKSLPIPILETPPLGLVLKVGRFRTALGRVNEMHTHDLPQTTRPVAHREILGDEGAIGSGVSAQFFLPLEWLDEQSTLQLTLQGLSGPHAGSEEPGHAVASLNWTRPLGDSHRLEVSAVGHIAGALNDRDATYDSTLGAEFIYQFRPAGEATFRGAIVGGQVLWAERRERGETRDVFGLYGFAQYQFSRELFLGVRYDRSQSFAHEERVQSVFPYLSWYPSEFFRLRVGWEQTLFDAPTPAAGITPEGTASLGTAWIEVNFVFGSHPPHPYWVNR